MGRIVVRVPGGWFAVGAALLMAVAALDCMALQLVTGRLDGASSLRWVLATLAPLGIAACMLPRWRQFGEGSWRHLAGSGLLLALTLIGLDLLAFGDPDGARWWELTRNKTAAAAALTLLAWRWPLAPSRAQVEVQPGLRLNARERGQIAAAPFLRAAGNYVEVGDGLALIRASLTQVTELPESRELVRVHRSFAVRASAVQELRNDRSGLVAIRLVNGDEVPVGRRYRAVAYRLRSCRSHPVS